MAYDIIEKRFSVVVGFFNRSGGLFRNGFFLPSTLAMYLPAANLTVAMAFSAALWSLLKPAGYSGITLYYSDVLTHPISGAVMLHIPDGVTVPLLNPDFTPLQSIALSTGHVTQNELDNLHAKAIANQGQQVLVSDYLPAYFLSISQTHDQLQAGGWFVTLP